MIVASERKVALITGGSGDIGSGVALGLAREGYDVAIAARSADKLSAVAKNIVDQTQRRAIGCAYDLRDAGSGTALVAEVVAALGQLDVLVTCAGAFKRGDILSVNNEDWIDAFNLMFFGAVRVTTAAWPHLKASRGHVIQVSGVHGVEPHAASAIPSAICAALINFNKANAELGRRDGVSVNCVVPGWISGHRLQWRVGVNAEQGGISREEAASRLLADLGIIRYGQPDDVANLIAFLVSERASYIHGAAIILDGGMIKGV